MDKGLTIVPHDDLVSAVLTYYTWSVKALLLDKEAHDEMDIYYNSLSWIGKVRFKKWKFLYDTLSKSISANGFPDGSWEYFHHVYYNNYYYNAKSCTQHVKSEGTHYLTPEQVEWVYDMIKIGESFNEKGNNLLSTTKVW